MEFHKFALAGPVEIVPHRIGDARGYSSEIFSQQQFAKVIDQDAAAPSRFEFVQENESRSALVGTIRGLHFQASPCAQGKLVRCTAGAIFDVAVDLRHDSPSFGRWVGVTLTPEHGNQFWVPPGFAHGFCTLRPDSVVHYRLTAYYSAEYDKGVAWNDPEIAVEWPPEADPATLSDKDRQQPSLTSLPRYFAMPPHAAPAPSAATRA